MFFFKLQLQKTHAVSTASQDTSISASDDRTDTFTVFW
jgi:hypothetical protein